MEQETILDKEQETSSQLFLIVEDDNIFSPISKVNSISGKFMSFETMQDTDDGTFPRVSDFTRLMNRIESDGTSEYLNWIGKGKLKIDNGYCTIIRDGKFSDKAIIEFKKPIKIIVATLNDKPVIIEVNRIHGEFTHEWFWTKNGRQDKIANGIEIYFDCQKYEMI